MTRFRWITLCRALDVLEACSTNAQFQRLFEEYGLGDLLDAEGGNGLTTPKLHSLLLRLLRRDSERTDTQGDLVSEGMVREAARFVEDRHNDDGSPWQSQTNHEKAELTAFRNSLAVDGWTVERKTLIPAAPVPLEAPRSRLRQNLDDPLFADARNRLDQLDAALDGGNCEAANGIARGFLASMFVAICQIIEKAASPREESDARKHLAEVGFFAGSRQDGKQSAEAEFVWKMSSMMGTEGVHAGASTPETAIYRYGLTVLAADYFLARCKKLIYER